MPLIRLLRASRVEKTPVVHAFDLVTLAVQSSVGEQLRRVPKETWINLVVGVVAIIALIRLWRGLRQINEYAPYLAAVFAGTVFFLAMVYYRNEPRFLTPIVEPLTSFFPTKAKQDGDLERLRRSREQ